MRVLVIFQPEFRGDPLDAVWIIDTPQNRAWFEQQGELIDGNSAVFRPADPSEILWNVFEHHPAWTEVVVRGAELNPDLASSLEPDAVVSEKTQDGLTLTRPK